MKSSLPDSKFLRELSMLRKQLALQSPKDFAKIYLQDHFTKSFSRMHEELFEHLALLTQTRSGRLAVAAPRGHAKSTVVSLAYLLWCLVSGKEKLILLVSATKEQAVQLLRTVKEELRKNNKLMTDFPELCWPESKRIKPWRENRILLPNGAMVCAYGAFQSLRGAKNGPHRPGLILVDDLETQDHVMAEEQRRKLELWFLGTLLHAGTPASNVVVVGTLLHFDSLLSKLSNAEQSAGWKTLKYQAVESFAQRQDLWAKWADFFKGRHLMEAKNPIEAARSFHEEHKAEMLEGASVLWPEMEDYYELMVIREREGRFSFQAEKQNQPLDPELCIFQEAKFQYWDDHFSDEDQLIRSCGEFDLVGACDPSLGRELGKGDFSAIVVLLVNRRTKVKYVLSADIARRSPDEIINRILKFAQIYRFSKFGLESNNFQTLLIQNLRERSSDLGIALPITGIYSRMNKITRIANLEPEISQQRIFFKRDQTLLLDQLRQFPLAKHDDGPDALEMAFQTYEALNRGAWSFQPR